METPVNNTTVRCVLVEPQSLLLQNAIRELEASHDIEVVASATTGKRGIKLIHDHGPDVAVVAFQTEDIDGLEVLEAVADLHKTSFIIRTSENSEQIVFECIVAGAQGYLGNWDIVDLADAIRRVNKGELVISAGSLRAFVEAVRTRTTVETAKQTLPSRLSPREREVLILLARGLNQGQIAQELGLSKTTVKTFCGNAYAKLGVHRSAAAVHEGIRRGEIHSRDI